MSDDGLVEVDVPGRTDEGCVEGEHPTVRRNQPVATGRPVEAHAHDRLVEVDVAGRTGEGRTSVGEHATVRGHQVVAGAVEGGRYCPPPAC